MSDEFDVTKVKEPKLPFRSARLTKEKDGVIVVDSLGIDWFYYVEEAEEELEIGVYPDLKCGGFEIELFEKEK